MYWSYHQETPSNVHLLIQGQVAESVGGCQLPCPSVPDGSASSFAPLKRDVFPCSPLTVCKGLVVRVLVTMLHQDQIMRSHPQVPPSLTSTVLHMDVVNVSSVLLLQSVSYPAALRVPLLAGLSLQRESLQCHTGTLNTTVLLKRALIKLQALGTRAAEEEVLEEESGGVSVENA